MAGLNADTLSISNSNNGYGKIYPLQLTSIFLSALGQKLFFK